MLRKAETVDLRKGMKLLLGNDNVQFLDMGSDYANIRYIVIH